VSDEMQERPPVFVAIDFETANRSPDSVVAMGLVRVVDGQVEDRFSTRIRPQTRRFVFTRVHGLRPADVAEAPEFGDVWRRARGLIEGARFLAAHHAAFDHGVLVSCCGRAGIAAPRLPFACTVVLARLAWGLLPTKLPHVCHHLGIPLQHHDAGSDAEACAAIVCAAWQTSSGRQWLCELCR
jgi:DNA polymerase III subunit epsilon